MDAPDFLTRPFTGSAHFYVSPRFFSDSVFGSSRGFDTWALPEFGASFGIMEFPYHIEPVVGVSYIQNTGNELTATDPSFGTSVDKFFYQLFTTMLGVRWQAWEQTKFLVIPYAEAGMTYRFGRYKKRTNAVGQKTSVVGGDVGGAFTGGAIISFFYDQQRKFDMNSVWSLKDFGATVFFSYLPSGLFRHGLGGVKDTGGYSFGAGLMLDW